MFIILKIKWITDPIEMEKNGTR